MDKADKIEAYFLQFDAEVQKKLAAIRRTIRRAAPEAEEVMSYGMPAYKQKGIIAWFAAHKEHIGFYPKAHAIEVFKEELSSYKCSKGTVQLPFNRPLPHDLITRIIRFNVNENIRKK